MRRAHGRRRRGGPSKITLLSTPQSPPAAEHPQSAFEGQPSDSLETSESIVPPVRELRSDAFPGTSSCDPATQRRGDIDGGDAVAVRFTHTRLLTLTHIPPPIVNAVPDCGRDHRPSISPNTDLDLVSASVNRRLLANVGARNRSLFNTRPYVEAADLNEIGRGGISCGPRTERTIRIEGSGRARCGEEDNPQPTSMACTLLGERGTVQFNLIWDNNAKFLPMPNRISFQPPPFEPSRFEIFSGRVGLQY